MLLECKVQDLKIKFVSGLLDDISEVEVHKMFIKDGYYGQAIIQS